MKSSVSARFEKTENFIVLFFHLCKLFDEIILMDSYLLTFTTAYNRDLLQ